MKGTWIELVVPLAITGVGVALGILTYLNLL